MSMCRLMQNLSLSTSDEIRGCSLFSTGLPIRAKVGGGGVSVDWELERRLQRRLEQGIKQERANLAEGRGDG